MRELTFKGFLRSYVRKLSRSGSLDPAKLAEEVTDGNARLCAPLVLYAIVSGTAGRLKGALGGATGADEVRRLLGALPSRNVEQTLRSGDAPEECLKVWNSYLVAHDAPVRDAELKRAVRKKVLQLQKETGCSNYRVYTDLKLNPGNVNCWLKQGDDRKVSYRTAEKILAYMVRRSALPAD